MQRGWERGMGAHEGKDVDGEQDEDEERDAVQDAGAGGRRRLLLLHHPRQRVVRLLSCSTPSKNPGRSGLLRRKSNTSDAPILLVLSIMLTLWL
jgi:hypothetical protein